MEEQLIEAVRHHILLYDTNHPDYMKSKLKQDIWDKIAVDVKLGNGDAAKSLWTKLRCSHRDALRRQKTCMKSGAAAETLRLWKFQKQMQFLVPYMANRPRSINLQNSNDEDQQTPLENTTTGTVYNEDIDNMEATTIDNNDVEIENNDDHDNPGDTNEETEQVISNTPRSVRSKKNMAKDNIGRLLQRSIVQREQRAKERALERKKADDSNTAHDSLFHFFMSMYKITQQMPPASQHLVRNKIFQTVSQAEGALLNMHPCPSFNANHNQLEPSTSQQIFENSQMYGDSSHYRYLSQSTPSLLQHSSIIELSQSQDSDNSNMSVTYFNL